MVDDDDRPAPSGRDVGAEDFLFHLFRGSELLQDNRVHEAKGELEQALAHKPADPKSQDLLAVVYFRLGMYPRAIAIYESLVRLHPESITPRVNLALCYVKTGQPELARAALERVLETNPEHARAWGYLGLTYQRLGDLEKARHAFLAGGHEGMARRVEELLGGDAPAPDSERTVLGLAAGEAAAALDRGALHADPGALEGDAPAAGRWSAIEPGREREAGHLDAFGAPPRSRSSPPDLAAPRAAFGSHPPGVPAAFTQSFAPSSLRPSMAPPSFAPGSFASPAWTPSGLPPPPAPAGPTTPTELARAALLLFERDASTAVDASGFVLLRGVEGVAARLDAVRALTCGAQLPALPLERRTRGRAGGEPLGGASSPLHSLEGRVEIVLAPPAGHRLFTVRVSDDDPLTLRESALVAFEAGVRYECGRMAVGDGEAAAVVQLKGHGSVVLAAHPSLSAIEVEGARSAMLRALCVLGWVGAVVPRALPPSEAPAGARGMVAFTGEGMVLFDAR